MASFCPLGPWRWVIMKFFKTNFCSSIEEFKNKPEKIFLFRSGHLFQWLFLKTLQKCRLIFFERKWEGECLFFNFIFLPLLSSLFAHSLLSLNICLYVFLYVFWLSYGHFALVISWVLFFSNFRLIAF